MLTSKQVLAQGGISRATLNNYIALGILPKPIVKNPGVEGGRARRLGHFPPTVLQTIARVRALKREGYIMADIVTRLKENDNQEPEPARSDDSGAGQSFVERRNQPDRRSAGAPLQSDGSLRLTLDRVEQPAYMVNSKFELEWANDSAFDEIFGGPHEFSGDISERNLFSMFFQGDRVRRAEGGDEMLRFHLSAAKKRVTKSSLLPLDNELADDDVARLLRVYESAEPAEGGKLTHTTVNLAPRGGDEQWCNIYVSYFREGIFFAYERTDDTDHTLVRLLSRRDIVIRDLLKRRRPYLTPLSVLVADLQDSMKICAELPPEEYFQLINEIWGAMEPKLRKYYATHGKHVGDGMVYYFFPQPDCSYVMNAIRCAFEMEAEMARISRAWRKRKSWLNELRLNVGLVEGQEWFGSYQTPTHFEFTALGDTINVAGRLSDFAQTGSIWTTKAMLGKLSTEELATLTYGIRRQGEDGTEVFVPATYSRVSNLIDLENPKNEKFKDIAVVPVTEIFDVENGAA